MSRIEKTGTNKKKDDPQQSSCDAVGVQKLRVEYWKKVKNIEPENLVFLDEMGVLLGLTRNYARSPSRGDNKATRYSESGIEREALVENRGVCEARDSSESRLNPTNFGKIDPNRERAIPSQKCCSALLNVPLSVGRQI